MDELKEILLSLSEMPNLPPEITSKIEEDDAKNWLPKDFMRLRTILQQMLDQLESFIFHHEIDNFLQFYNHLKRTDSVIIKAMIEGSWLLLDGIPSNLEYKSSIEKINNSQLKEMIEFNYSSLMNDSNSKFLETVDEKFEQVIDVNIFEFIKKAQLSTSKGCIEIINLIDKYIDSIKENIQAKFGFEIFFHWLLQIHLKDIEAIYDKIRYTLINTFRQKNCRNCSKNPIIEPPVKKLFSHWSSIRCIEILVDEISHSKQENIGNDFSKNATLNSPQVQDISSFKIILKKIRCILLFRIQQKTLSSNSRAFVCCYNTDGNFSTRKQRINNTILEYISSYNVESITIGIGAFQQI